jgi:hypothetical protein
MSRRTIRSCALYWSALRVMRFWLCLRAFSYSISCAVLRLRSGFQAWRTGLSIYDGELPTSFALFQIGADGVQVEIKALSIPAPDKSNFFDNRICLHQVGPEMVKDLPKSTNSFVAIVYTPLP